MAEQLQSRASVRLIFEYQGDDIRLLSEEPVEMVVPDTEPLSRSLPAPGFYVDLRDEADGLLSRTPLHGALDASIEVFPERLGEPIARVPAPGRSGAFTVVVPAVPSADHVAVIDVPPPPPPGTALPSGAGEVRELARFRLSR